MGDRTYQQLQILECPADQVANVLAVINEYHYGPAYDGHGTETELLLGDTYVIEENNLGTALEVAGKLKDLPGVSFEVWEDPKYEWDGDYYAHVEGFFGLYNCSISGEGDLHVSSHLIESIIDRHANDVSAAGLVTDLHILLGTAIRKRIAELHAALAESRTVLHPPPLERVIDLGYSTHFNGEITIQPPLNDAEAGFLKDFAGTRRMDRENGPYFVAGTGVYGQNDDPDVRNSNAAPEGQPGLWCQWTPNVGSEFFTDAEEGAALVWDGGEKFYESENWMVYLINHFLKPGAEASKDLEASVAQDPRFALFTFDHTLNGEIEAQGEDPDDRWKLIVEDNIVKTSQVVITWAEALPVQWS